MTTRATAALKLAGLAAAALLASGCGLFSPVQTAYDYIPADGVPLTVPGLELRNLLVVADEEGGPGTIVGQAVNDGSEAVEVSFGLEGAGAATTTVPAYSEDALSLGGSPLVVDAVPQAPGAMVQLVVTTPEAGQNIVLVPVLPSTRYYEELEASASPSPSPSATPSPSETSSASPSASPSPSAG